MERQDEHPGQEMVHTALRGEQSRVLARSLKLDERAGVCRGEMEALDFMCLQDRSAGGID